METTPGQKPKFSLEVFRVEPKTNYSDLTQEVDGITRMREEMRAGHDELATDHISKCADDLIGMRRGKLDAEMSKKSESARVFLKERLVGKILVDLGGGESRSMESLAHMLGVSVYIRVDAYFQSSLADEHGRLADRGKMEPGGEMEVYHVKFDMLEFLSTLPDDSVCVTINGIDMSVIHSEAYHRALTKEMIRVLAPDGVIFGRLSESLNLIQDDLQITTEQRETPTSTIELLNFPNKFNNFYLDTLKMFGKVNK